MKAVVMEKLKRVVISCFEIVSVCCHAIIPPPCFSHRRRGCSDCAEGGC